jgi:hypothetical protein
VHDRLVPADGARDVLAVAEIAHERAHAETVELRRGAAARGVDLVPAAQELLDDGLSEEAVAARHEHLHRRRILSACNAR